VDACIASGDQAAQRRYAATEEPGCELYFGSGVFFEKKSAIFREIFRDFFRFFRTFSSFFSCAFRAFRAFRDF
jgi:hypothetical protein